MEDKKIEPFIKPDPEAYACYKKAKRKKKVKNALSSAHHILKIISQVILWICAVGGFALALIQFFQQ